MGLDVSRNVHIMHTTTRMLMACQALPLQAICGGTFAHLGYIII